MIQKFLVSLAFLLTAQISAWGQAPPDTLYANERQVLSVFFQQPIEKAITGASHFAFTFNREHGETLGLLQATQGEPSNLLVVTAKDGIYSFILAYRDSLERFTHFIPESSGLEKGSSTNDKAPEIPPISQVQMERISKQMLSKELPLNKTRNRMGLQLKMTDRFYHESLVYIRYELYNGSPIDYEVEKLSLLKVLGTTARKSSFQELILSPVFTFKVPELIAQGTAANFIVVYPKFTLGPKESLKISLQEKRGSRHLSFKVKDLY